MLLKGVAVDITDFMGSKAKGTDNPIGLNFRMCAFHRFLYISTAFVLVLFLAYSLIILGFSVALKRKWQCTHFPSPNRRVTHIYRILQDMFLKESFQVHIQSQMT